LTWDQDDPERDRVTRRALTLKDLEKNDFHAYVASSSDSSSEDETKSTQKTANRDKLRALLLSDGDNDLPEGWAGSKTGDIGTDDGRVDMEVTFRPALSGGNDEDETTIGRYQRKMREKRKTRKQELKDKSKGRQPPDDFFAQSEEEEEGDESPRAGRRAAGAEQGNKTKNPSTKEELSLLVAPDKLDSGPKHFDMAAIIKAEKNERKKRKGRRKQTGGDDENELQDDFTIDVKDERFRALHEDHVFAIDPSNPQ
jgi:NUC153 domain-containing protein